MPTLSMLRTTRKLGTSSGNASSIRLLSRAFCQGNLFKTVQKEFKEFVSRMSHPVVLRRHTESTSYGIAHARILSYALRCEHSDSLFIEGVRQGEILVCEVKIGGCSCYTPVAYSLT